MDATIKQMPGQFIAGGQRAAKVARHGQISIALQEINEEPAIVMWRTHHSVLGRKTGAFVVALSSYHRYFDSHTAKPTEYAMQSIVHAALPVMGFSPLDRDAAHQVLDLLFLYADDVVRLRPDMEQRRQADKMPDELEAVELAIDGKTVTTIEH